MNQRKSIGITCAIAAAFIYGFTPILARITYEDGSNTVTLTFFRSLMSVPVLFLLLKARGESLKVTKSELGKLILLGLLGACATGLLLYGSYNYISVGLTTTIHYIYPVLVTVACVALFHEKISRTKVLALVLSMGGILLFFDEELSVNLFGVFLAVSSGVAYAAYLIVMDKSGIKGMNPFKISFYCCAAATVFLFFYGTGTGELVYGLTPRGWIFTALVAVFVAVIANTLTPIAVKNVGSTVTSILGMFEPIVSVTLGILFLGEPCSFRSILGCGLIITAVTLLTLEKDREKSS